MAVTSSRRRWPIAAAIVAVAAALMAAYLSPTIFADKPFPKQVFGRKNVILMAVNSENGLSNVHMATAFSLAKDDASVEIHIASFDKLRPEVERVSAAAGGKPFTFHSFNTSSQAIVFDRNFGSEEALISAPGLQSVRRFTSNVEKFFIPWAVDEYFTIFSKTTDLINTIDPAVVVLDSLLPPAIDATRQADRVHAFLSPNALVDLLAPRQPYGAMLWKYPVIGTGYPFPLPWHLIPANAWAAISFVYSLISLPDVRAKQAALRELGLKNPFDFMSMVRDDAPWIASELAEARLPLPYIPPNVTACGPMVLSVATAEEQDPELARWLSQSPTVLINLGSITRYDSAKANVMASSLRRVLEETSDIQVLWKLKKHGDYEDHAIEPLREFVESGRANVVEWLHADPAALLDTSNIVLSVHHGGANCFFETIWAGIPHVVLPMWIDLYNFATLAEYLGVGVYASRKTAPDWSVEELSGAILGAVGNSPKAVGMRFKAVELGIIAREQGGRDCAAREISKLASTGYE